MVEQILFISSILALVISVSLSFYAFRSRNYKGAIPFAWMMILISLIAITEIIAMTGKTDQNALLFYHIRYFFVPLLPVAWLITIKGQYGYPGWLKKWLLALIALIPFFAIVLGSIPSFRHLWFQQRITISQIGFFWFIESESKESGLLLNMLLVYLLGLFMGGLTIVLFDLWKRRTVSPKRSFIILVGTIFTILVTAFSIFNKFPLRESVPFSSILGLMEIILIVLVLSLLPQKRERTRKSRKKTDNPEPMSVRTSLTLMLIFIIITVSIVSTGIISTKRYALQYLSQVEAQIQSISLLKAKNIIYWRQEKLFHADTFFENKSFSKLVETYLQTEEKKDLEADLLSWFEAFISSDEYDAIAFFDPEGIEILSASSVFNLTPAHLKKDIAESIKNHSVEIIDFHRDYENSPVHMAMVIPVYSEKKGDPLGALVTRIDPSVKLYPLILDWPVPSETAETAIFRKMGEDAIYLSELKFRPNSALREIIDHQETHRPSIKAINGFVGITDGINYRGHEVIADVRPIPETDWYLISRIDKAEALQPLTERERFAWFFYSSLILMTIAAFWVQWRQQQLRVLTAQNQAQAEIVEEKRKLKEAERIAHIGFWYWDVETGDVDWSDEVYQLFGLSPKTYTPNIKSILEKSPWPEEQNRGQELIERCYRSRQPGTYDQKFLRPDHSVGYYSSTYQGVYDDNGKLTAIVGSVIDTTERTLRDQALRESEKRFRTLFEQAAIGVAILDTRTGRYLDINQKYCDLLGYTKEEMLERTFQSVTASKYDKLNIQKNKALLEGKIKEYSLEKKYIKKDGSEIWGHLIASPLWETQKENGEYQHIAVVSDITERKNAELALRTSEKKFREVVENLSEGYYNITIDGTILDHNPAFASLMGYPSDHVLIGESVLPIWQDVGERQQYLDELFKHGSISSYQIKAKRKNGQPSTLLISAHLIREEDGTPVRIEGVVLDITARIEQEEKILATQKELQRLLDEADQSRRALLNIVEDQKQAQMEIKRLNKDLEERVAKRTAQLRASNEELESFAYSISHDLRAPLRAIDGYSLILAQDYGDKLDEEGHRLINIIRSSTRNMDNLITHLLSLSRVGRTELKYEKIDMTKMVETVFKEIASAQEMEKIEFSLTLLPSIMADSSLIRQVWINLISNAIKYSAPKEKPQIRISGKKEKGFCTYRIEDNGVGFNPDFKENLFTLFQRLHKPSEFEGSGVGLTIVQRIIHRHNGQIWGDGRPGEGAEFSFKLPCKKEEHA